MVTVVFVDVREGEGVLDNESEPCVLVADNDDNIVGDAASAMVTVVFVLVEVADLVEVIEAVLSMLKDTDRVKEPCVLVAEYDDNKVADAACGMVTVVFVLVELAEAVLTTLKDTDRVLESCGPVTECDSTTLTDARCGIVAVVFVGVIIDCDADADDKGDMLLLAEVQDMVFRLRDCCDADGFIDDEEEEVKLRLLLLLVETESVMSAVVVLKDIEWFGKEFSPSTVTSISIARKVTRSAAASIVAIFLWSSNTVQNYLWTHT